MATETLFLSLSTIAFAGGWLWSHLRCRNLQRARRDIVAAYAARHDSVVLELASHLSSEDEALWRRLITTRATLEENAQEATRARRDLEDVLASLQDAVLVVDAEARLRFLNEAALRLFDVRIEDVLGALLIEALPSFGIDAAMRAALREGKSSAHEVHLYSPKLREVFLRVSPVFSASGSEAGAVAILQDLTELRRLERVRRDFVANASHELRTPIANIRATAETMQGADNDPAVVARFLPPLITEAERLSRLVTDLLNLARAETQDQAPFAPVELQKVVSDVVASLQDKARRRDITLKWQPNGVAPVVSGDGASLEQVAFNLVDNALSYTPSGGQVALQLHERPTVQKDGATVNSTAVIEISDSGIGIPEADLPRIFERFYRVDKARSRSEGGTGLGLAIVKHIIENHGGHVQVQSEVGKGTTFRVELPVLDEENAD